MIVNGHTFVTMIIIMHILRTNSIGFHCQVLTLPIQFTWFSGRKRSASTSDEIKQLGVDFFMNELS